MLQNNQKELILLKDLGYLKPKETSNYKKRFAIYKCFCGKEFKTQTRSVDSGLTTSCGCYNKQIVTKHGYSKNKLYAVWHSMISRCKSDNKCFYDSYKGKNIKVCDRWLYLSNFIEDMQDSYVDGLTIDRIDNNNGYCPDNCRWTTNTIQQRNKRILQKNNKTGFRGVRFIENRNKWRCTISVNKININLGMFKDKMEAVYAYDNYIIKNNLEHPTNLATKSNTK